MFILNGQKISNDFRINSQNEVGSEFDLNTPFYGIKHINGEKPKNYPDNFLPWGICISIETVASARVQIAIDTLNHIAIRNYAGQLGSLSWSNWKVLGGVNRSTICYAFIPRMEVAA